MPKSYARRAGGAGCRSRRVRLQRSGRPRRSVQMLARSGSSVFSIGMPSRGEGQRLPVLAEASTTALFSRPESNSPQATVALRTVGRDSPSTAYRSLSFGFEATKRGCAAVEYVEQQRPGEGVGLPAGRGW